MFRVTRYDHDWFRGEGPPPEVREAVVPLDELGLVVEELADGENLSILIVQRHTRESETQPCV